MTYQVQITGPALKDMRMLSQYIAVNLQSPAAAKRRMESIREAIQSLAENPSRLALVQDDYLASLGYRKVIVKNHLVFYVVREEAGVVLVMRVLYGRRDWQHLLTEDTSLT